MPVNSDSFLTMRGEDAGYAVSRYNFPGKRGIMWSLLVTQMFPVAVLIVPTTQPESIEQYSIRVADAWKIGRQGVDDGVIQRTPGRLARLLRRL